MRQMRPAGQREADDAGVVGKRQGELGVGRCEAGGMRQAAGSGQQAWDASGTCLVTWHVAWQVRG